MTIKIVCGRQWGNIIVFMTCAFSEPTTGYIIVNLSFCLTNWQAEKLISYLMKFKLSSCIVGEIIGNHIVPMVQQVSKLLGSANCTNGSTSQP